MRDLARLALLVATATVLVLEGWMAALMLGVAICWWALVIWTARTWSEIRRDGSAPRRAGHGCETNDRKVSTGAGEQSCARGRGRRVAPERLSLSLFCDCPYPVVMALGECVECERAVRV